MNAFIVDASEKEGGAEGAGASVLREGLLEVANALDKHVNRNLVGVGDAVDLGLHTSPSDQLASVRHKTGGRHTDVLIDLAKRVGAESIHPGYGFLAERADFAKAVEDAGLVFVGPLADTIAAMGDKTEARRRMAAAGVPIVPVGIGGSVKSLPLGSKIPRPRKVVAVIGDPRG